MQESTSLRDKLLAEAAARPRPPTRTEGRRRAALLYVLGAIAGLPLFFAWGGLAHSEGRPLAITMATAVTALLIALIAGWLAWRRGASLNGRPLGVLVAVSLLVPALTYASLVVWQGTYTEPFERVGYRCLVLTIASAVPLLGVALWLRRRRTTVNPVATGAALGMAAGALGAISADLWCPLTNSPHVLIGHVLPLVILAALGAVAGRVVLALRAR